MAEEAAARAKEMQEVTARKGRGEGIQAWFVVMIVMLMIRVTITRGGGIL